MKLYRFRSGSICKLFVGGLHGDEGLYTAPVLEILAGEAETVPDADIIIVPAITTGARYVGVLTEAYYHTREGMILTGLIKRYKPRFYFELHAYSEKSYSRLTSAEREKIEGVPPFVDLGKRVLIGSIAPVLRNTLFSTDDFCLTIELPHGIQRDHAVTVREHVLDILRLGLRCRTKIEMLGQLRRMYPEQVERAEELFLQYYRSHPYPSAPKLEPF